MPYTAEHKQKSREKLLNSAFELFAHKGFDSVTIDDITQCAGLTRGSFYNHFSSKQALYSEAMLHAAQHSLFKQHIENSPSDTNTLISLIESYLSPEHLTREHPCPLAFLVTDVANQQSQVRETYTHIFINITKHIKRVLNKTGHTQQSGEMGQVIAAMMIGGVAVSRALNDKSLSDQLLRACRAIATDMVRKT